MNEELQKAIAELFNSVISAKDFLVAELPEYINQLLMWHAVKSGIFTIAGILFCAIWAYANYRHFLWLKKNWEEYIEGIEPILLLHMCQLFILSVPCKLISIEWLQILIAPKVWLVEYAAQLIK